jgi:hypothetical protein
MQSRRSGCQGSLPAACLRRAARRRGRMGLLAPSPAAGQLLSLNAPTRLACSSKPSFSHSRPCSSPRAAKMRNDEGEVGLFAAFGSLPSLRQPAMSCLDAGHLRDAPYAPPGPAAAWWLARSLLTPPAAPPPAGGRHVHASGEAGCLQLAVGLRACQGPAAAISPPGPAHASTQPRMTACAPDHVPACCRQRRRAPAAVAGGMAPHAPASAAPVAWRSRVRRLPDGQPDCLPAPAARASARGPTS